MSIYAKFKGERAPKKRNFLVKFFQKVPKNSSLDLCFQKLLAAQNLVSKFVLYNVHETEYVSRIELFS